MKSPDSCSLQELASEIRALEKTRKFGGRAEVWREYRTISTAEFKRQQERGVLPAAPSPPKGANPGDENRWRNAYRVLLLAVRPLKGRAIVCVGYSFEEIEGLVQLREQGKLLKQDYIRKNPGTQQEMHLVRLLPRSHRDAVEVIVRVRGQYKELQKRNQSRKARQPRSPINMAIEEIIANESARRGYRPELRGEILPVVKYKFAVGYDIDGWHIETRGDVVECTKGNKSPRCYELADLMDHIYEVTRSPKKQAQNSG